MINVNGKKVKLYIFFNDIKDNKIKQKCLSSRVITEWKR